MELGSNIKKHRTALGWNQEVLAEKAYVSRQTVSNWENEKSYPDVHSLLILSDLFSVSIDELIKGDVEIMKKTISDENVRVFRRWSNIYGVMFLLLLFSPILMTKLGVAGIIISAIYWSITMAVAIRVELLKKKNNIQTYREIVAFVNGESLDDIENRRNSKTELIQKILFGMASGILIVVVMVVFERLLG